MIKPLSFEMSPEARRFELRPRMSRRAWYVVFGASRIEKDQKISSKDLAMRLHTVYDDIDPAEIFELIDSYVEERRNANV